MSVIHVNGENFKEVVLDSDKPVLVDFMAQWCGPCQSMAPVIEELGEELQDMKVCKLDIDDAMDLARQYHVMSVPSFLIFEGGEVAKRTVGGQSKEEMMEFLGK
jgi:thioredoxin 1